MHESVWLAPCVLARKRSDVLSNSDSDGSLNFVITFTYGLQIQMSNKLKICLNFEKFAFVILTKYIELHLSFLIKNKFSNRDSVSR